MAHYCIFCEQHFRTFTQIRKHTCVPESPVAGKPTFPAKPFGPTVLSVQQSDPITAGSISLTGTTGISDATEISGEEEEESQTMEEVMFHRDPRGLYSPMSLNHSRSSLEQLANFYRETERRNQQEMNNSDIKDFRLSSPSSSHDNSPGSNHDNSPGSNRDDSPSSNHDNSQSDKEDDDTEGCLVIDSDFVYTLEDAESDKSDSSKEVLDNEIENEKSEGVGNVDSAEGPVAGESGDVGYVYVMDTDRKAQVKSQEGQGNTQEEALCLSVKHEQKNTLVEALCLTKKQEQKNTHAEALCLSKKQEQGNTHEEALCLTKSQEQGSSQDEVLCLSTKVKSPVSFVEQKQNSEVLRSPVSFLEQKQNGDAQSNDSGDEVKHISVKTSPVLEPRNQNAYTKEQAVDSNGPVKLVGASKRKRKSTLESTILHIMKNKVSRLDDHNDDRESNSSNSTTQDDADRLAAISEPAFNGHSVMDLSVKEEKIENDNKLPVDLSKSVNEEARRSPETLSVGQKVNRRKSSMVARCINSGAEEQTLVYQQKEEPKDVNQPLDFSVKKTTNIKPEYKPEYKPEVATKLFTPKQEKEEVLDLSASSIKKPNGIKPASSGRQNAQNLPTVPNLPNQAQFMEMMKRYPGNFMNQNMMANFLQLQMWMQATALNNNNNNNTNKVNKRGRKGPGRKSGGYDNVNDKNGVESDMNKNVIMRDMLSAQSLTNIAKPNMNMFMGGPFPNNPSPFSSPNGLSKPGLPDSPFSPNGLSNGSPFSPNGFTKSSFPESPFSSNGLSKLGLPDSGKPSFGTPFSEKLEGMKLKLEKPESPMDDLDLGLGAEGVTNWTPNPTFGDTTKQALTDFKEKDGSPVKFFVKDNEQVSAIVNSLLAAGMVTEGEVTVGSEDMKYICRICEQRFFHVEHLTKHVKKRHVLKKYQCTMCERSFHDAGNYRQHMRVHDANDVPYECPECQRRFRHKCTLKVHMRIHTGEKPFKCEICSASFKISSGLQTHMRKHTGETPYACEFCNMRFKCQSNLKQHLFQHTQARPFPCEVCGKSYSRKSIRDTHMQTHYKAAEMMQATRESTLLLNDKPDDTHMQTHFQAAEMMQATRESTLLLNDKPDYKAAAEMNSNVSPMLAQ